MLADTSWSFRLFRAFGIDVFLHWSWLLAAYVLFVFLPQEYLAGNAAVFLTLFAIVVMHEFGHALACRSVGGQAEKIVLWPLGGVAYVRPPQRPGAWLWSIAAGPLVNVALVPVTLGAAMVVSMVAEPDSALAEYVSYIVLLNLGLLIFNMLPIYPLDGGQILWSLLWFVMGRSKSLLWSARLGLACAIVMGVAMVALNELWLVVIAVFIGFQAWRGIWIARLMAYEESQARNPYEVLEPWER